MRFEQSFTDVEGVSQVDSWGKIFWAEIKAGSCHVGLSNIKEAGSTGKEWGGSRKRAWEIRGGQ